MTRIRWSTLSVWLLASCIAAMSCSLIRPAARIGAEYFPVGHDSFYHATRILQAVEDPAAFYEFDRKIHVPEGSLLVWPWGYDYFVAKVVRASVALGFGSEPLQIMLWMPVFAVLIGIGLMIICARRLGLSTWPTALAGLCMALSHSTQLIYGYGQIDHHYAEQIFILAALAAGLSWFRAPSIALGITLGAVFGIALAVHNGLFILLLPFLATAATRWLQDQKAPLRPTFAFAAALLGAAIAVLLPSQPFQEGRFEFYRLSWFHLYVVACTAVVSVLLAYLRPTRRSIAGIIALAAALLVPLLNQIGYAQSFVSGRLGNLDVINEVQSPLQLAMRGDVEMLSGFYSLLIWLAPATFALCVLQAWRERQNPRLLFWIVCMLGMALLSSQVRMHYFGIFALYLPWLLVAEDFASRRAELYKRTFLIVSLALVLAYAPVIRHGLVAPVPKGGDITFAWLSPMFPSLREACERDPGVVLADTNAGHYIRYVSKCSVIANNFLLTKQHFQKADEVDRLLTLPADQLSLQAPYVKYVLVRAGNVTRKEEGKFAYEFYGKQGKGLSWTLLMDPTNVPPQFQLIYTVTLEKRGQDVPYAKLYKVVPVATAASVNNVSE
jgi:hypothetical protein